MAVYSSPASSSSTVVTLQTPQVGQQIIGEFYQETPIDKIAVRRFGTTITGSIREFANDPSRATVLLASEFGIKYRKAETKIGHDREGDPTRAFLHNVSVLQAGNTFSHPLLASASQGIRGNLYAGDQRGFLMVGPSSSPTVYGPTGLPVLFTHQALYNSLYHEFGRYDPSKIENDVDDVMFKGMPYKGVPPESFIAEFLLENEKDANGAYNMSRWLQTMTDANGEQYQVYVLPAPFYNQAVKVLKDQLHAIAPAVDFSSLKIQIQPAGKTWKELATHYETELGDESKAYLDTPGTFYVELLIKYRLQGH